MKNKNLSIIDHDINIYDPCKYIGDDFTINSKYSSQYTYKNGIDDILKDLEDSFIDKWKKNEFLSDEEKERRKKVKFRQDRLNKILNKNKKHEE